MIGFAALRMASISVISEESRVWRWEGAALADFYIMIVLHPFIKIREKAEALKPYLFQPPTPSLTPTPRSHTKNASSPPVLVFLGYMIPSPTKIKSVGVLMCANEVSGEAAVVL